MQRKLPNFPIHTFRCFQAWHRYLNTQIANNKLNIRVFTVNNHYLMHLKFIIEQVGPLKAYSCRSLERTIKKFRNLANGHRDLGVNSSNVLANHTRYNTVYMQDIYTRLRPNRQNAENSFLSHPSGDRSLPQLWEPFCDESLEGDGVVNCCGVQRTKVARALKKFYARTYGRSDDVNNTSFRITIAGNAWKDSIVISSVYAYNNKSLVRSRANNIVLFEVQGSR